MPHTSKLVLLLDRLIANGANLVKSAVPNRNFSGPMIPDTEAVHRWSDELILFKALAGSLVSPWADRLVHTGFALIPSAIEEPLATLRTIKFAIDEGLLNRYEDLIIAEAIGDLTEQANYLLEQGFFLAAGVIFRAVLEERLRKLCERSLCSPVKPRPTIEDFNQSLYKAQVYDKSMMLHVTSLAAIGNNAAHNQPSLQKDDVKRLADGVGDFLARFSP